MGRHLRRQMRAELKGLLRRGKTEQRIATRARIVLERLFKGRSVSQTARCCGVSRSVVRKWVERYFADPCLEGLKDLPRTGRPPTITTRDHGIVISIACQKPSDFGRLKTTMFQEIIVEEAAKEGTLVSRSSVQRILAAAETKPQHERYYLFTRKDDPEYAPRRDAICDLYMRHLPDDEIVVCFDEKTGMQILGNPDKGAVFYRKTQPGMVALQEHNYKRLGSRTLSVVVRPDTGEVIVGKLFSSEEGYATAQAIGMLRDALAALSNYRVVHLVLDNASTHVSKEMKAFLKTEAAERLQLYYTPTHASWLNLAENFFSRFSRRYLRKRRYESIEAFETFLKKALDDYNERCHGMKWTYNPKEQRKAA